MRLVRAHRHIVLECLLPADRQCPVPAHLGSIQVLVNRRARFDRENPRIFGALTVGFAESGLRATGVRERFGGP